MQGKKPWCRGFFLVLHKMFILTLLKRIFSLSSQLSGAIAYISIHSYR
ncbi:hypothetical protein [Okeania sp. SIO1I7]|nr:hypothetical protein [Okeania sp. SIO1I7]NET29194.1 hypothetical protein [Okeania sp. SIO1I7]